MKLQYKMYLMICPKHTTVILPVKTHPYNNDHKYNEDPMTEDLYNAFCPCMIIYRESCPSSKNAFKNQTTICTRAKGTSQNPKVDKLAVLERQQKHSLIWLSIFLVLHLARSMCI